MNISNVLSGGAGPQGIRSLLLSAKARKVLADQLRSLLPSGAVVRSCRPIEVRFKPGREIAAYYEVSVNLAGSEEHYVRPVAVTWGANNYAGRDEETIMLDQINMEATRRGVATPFLQLMADYPEWTMRVWVSPLDARFTQLVRLLDPQYVCAMLADRAGAFSDRQGGGEYSVTSIKYRPGRCHVLRYDPLGPGAETIFAKLYIIEDGARAFRRENPARAFRLANQAAEWLARHGDNANVLRPLAYVAEDAVVLYPRVVGTSLSDYARGSLDGVAAWLQHAGATLHTLHQMPAASVRPLGPPHDFASEIRLIAKKGGHIPALHPGLGTRIDAVLDRAQALHQRLPQETPTFTHGDFKSEHIWVGDGQLMLMDFDTAQLADPALDVGCFLADWYFSQGSSQRAAFEAMRTSFLSGYAPSVPKDRLLRARLYEAIELVKCAVRRVQLFEHDWASRTARLVLRAEDLINELQLTLGLPPRPVTNTGNPNEKKISLFSRVPALAPVDSEWS